MKVFRNFSLHQRNIQPILSVMIAFVIAGIIITLTSGHPLESLNALAYGAFGSTNGIWRTLAKATPLILAGLGVAVALKGGLFNIGAEGQLLVGGLATAWVGYAFKGLPWLIHCPLALGAGAAAGMIWASVPGALKAFRGSHEVIVSIMMNYVAIQLTHYMVNNPMRDIASAVMGTPSILPTAKLPFLDSNSICSSGLLIALIMAIIVHIFVQRTALGLELRAIGQNSDAARFAGINVSATTMRTMAISGALAGMAGAVEVLGVHHRFLDAFSPGYGFDSIAVALLGNCSSGGVVASSILFGGISSGALHMEIATDTPRQIAGIIQALVIVAAGAKLIRRKIDS